MSEQRQPVTVPVNLETLNAPELRALVLQLVAENDALQEEFDEILDGFIYRLQHLFGQLVLFSTESGDAWLLDPLDHLAARLARDGEPEPIHIEDTEPVATQVLQA